MQQCGKTKYDKQGAIRAMKGIVKSKENKEIFKYYCKYCQNYHITKSKPRNLKFIIRKSKNNDREY